MSGGVWHNGSLMRGIGGVLSAAALTWVAVGSVALGCGGREDSRATCSDDADCGASARCERSRAPGPSPEVRGTPCPFVSCTDTSECGVGLVCGPLPPEQRINCGPTGCVAPCTEGSCGTGWICLDNGVCEIVPCDEPGSLECPEHWTCAPDSPDGAKQSVTPAGSTLADPDGIYDLVQAGCVRRTCADEDGYGCADFYVCDPDTATNPTGCVAVPCTESGHCSNDAFICTPTSSASRDIGVDPFGCVLKNCEEGVDCSYRSTLPGAGYCNPSAPYPSANGCAIHSCLDDDYDCAATETCDPGNPNANIVGCVPEGSAVGGTGGTTGGTGGSGGAVIPLGGTTGGSDVTTGGSAGASEATGGGATGGTSGTGQDFGPGRCVPR